MSQTRLDLQTTDVLMFVHNTLVSLQPLISDPRNLQFFSLVGRCHIELKGHALITAHQSLLDNNLWHVVVDTTQFQHRMTVIPPSGQSRIPVISVTN